MGICCWPSAAASSAGSTKCGFSRPQSRRTSKRGELTPAGLRVEMLELAIAGQPAFSVCRYEVDRGGVNYSFETLAHFREEDPDA